MAAYVLERDRWDERVFLKSEVLETEEKVKRWLKTNDWRWYLEDEETRAHLQQLATGIRDVQKKELPSMPDINIRDEVLVMGHASHVTGSRGPEWLYRICRR